METVIKLYPEAWHKVEYQVDETVVNFTAWKIRSLDSENVEKSELDEEPVLKGFIKWDGCCEFEYSTHICGFYGAQHFLELMKEIYLFKGSLGGSFEEEDVL